MRRVLLLLVLLSLCLNAGCSENARISAKGQADMGVSAGGGR